MRIVVAILLMTLASWAQDQLPDAPSRVQTKQVKQVQSVPDNLRSLSWSDTLHSKTFWAVHGAFLASTVFDIEVTHQGLAHHQCLENGENSMPSRGYLYAHDMPWVAGVTFVDLIFRKLGVPIAPYVPAAVGTVKHLHGGTRWLTECW